MITFVPSLKYLNELIKILNNKITAIYNNNAASLHLLKLQLIPYITNIEDIRYILIGNWPTGTSITGGTDWILSFLGNGTYRVVDGVFGRTNSLFVDVCMFHAADTKSLDVPSTLIYELCFIPVQEFLRSLEVFGIPFVALHPNVGCYVADWLKIPRVGPNRIQPTYWDKNSIIIWKEGEFTMHSHASTCT